jgi:hypothetical protein
VASPAGMSYIGRPNDIFGIIVSIKEVFGVIQLLRSEEQILFSVRDGNRDVAIGKLALQFQITIAAIFDMTT